MESWSYVSVGNGAVTNDSVSPSDSSSVSKNSVMGWELSTPCRLRSNMLVSNQVDIGNQTFRQSDIEELVIKRVPNDSIKDVLCSENHAMYPFMSNPDKSFGEDESTSKLSSSAVESYGIWNSSLIDLNVGRYADQRGGHSSKFSHGATILSSCESSTPPRRVRLAGVSLHTACCQVYGCNKDLSSSKDYHKRHKVCEGHSKAAKVIVNEVEQRFCHQCSRFHVLDEFDDGKRSCRKRLADHNERRRKPQFDIHSGRTGKLLDLHAAFAGCTYQGTKLPMPFISYQDIHRGIFYPEKCVTDHRSKRLKLEDETQYNPLSAISTANANLQSRSVSIHYDFRKDVPSFHGNEGSTAAESIFSVTSARHPHDLGGPNSGSSPLFQDISLASDDDFNGFDTGSTIQGLPAMSESGRALSLLSSKSQESSIPLCGIHVARPLDVTGSSSTHYNINQASEKLIGVSSGASNELSSTENNNPVEGSNLGSVLMPHSRDAANLDVSSRFYQGLCFINSNDHLSYEDGATIDLLHQSSQLQRVEHQRESMQTFLPSRW